MEKYGVEQVEEVTKEAGCAKCPKCDLELEKKGTGYWCPKCGTEGINAKKEK